MKQLVRLSNRKSEKKISAKTSRLNRKGKFVMISTSFFSFLLLPRMFSGYVVPIVGCFFVTSTQVHNLAPLYS